MGLKALVIEDSLVFQKIIGAVLKSVPGVDHVEVAGTGAEGLALVLGSRPDVVFLDLHLPDMDGMDVLIKIKEERAETRVVVVSGLSGEGAALTIKALSRGAQQFISKPSGGGFQASVAALKAELEPVVKTVSLQMGLAGRRTTAVASGPAGTLPATRPKPMVSPRPRATPVAVPVSRAGSPVGPRSFWVVGFAVSTGGPEALNHVIPRLPAKFPLPIVIVQHMPPLFTLSLAESLDKKSQVTVSEAKAGDILEAGHVYIAPGGKHMVVREVDGKPVVALNERPPEQSVRPAADVLFRSLATCGGTKSVLSVVMTGMGEDGLAGVRLLNTHGNYCVTQAEATCVVYGMPRAVDVAGLSNEKLALDDIADRLVALTATSVAAVRI